MHRRSRSGPPAQVAQQGWQTGNLNGLLDQLADLDLHLLLHRVRHHTVHCTVRSTWCISHVVTCWLRVSVLGSQTMYGTSRVRCSNLHSVTVQVRVRVSQWYSQT